MIIGRQSSALTAFTVLAQWASTLPSPGRDSRSDQGCESDSDKSRQDSLLSPYFLEKLNENATLPKVTFSREHVRTHSAPRHMPD